MKKITTNLLVSISFILIQFSAYSYSGEESALTDIYTQQNRRIESLIGNLKKRLNKFENKTRTRNIEHTTVYDNNADNFWQDMVDEQDRYFDFLRRKYSIGNRGYRSYGVPYSKSYTSLLGQYGYGNLANGISGEVSRGFTTLPGQTKSLGKTRDKVLRNQLVISILEKKLGIENPKAYHPPERAKELFENAYAKEIQGRLERMKAEKVQKEKSSELERKLARSSKIRKEKREEKSQEIRRKLTPSRRRRTISRRGNNLVLPE